MPSKAKAVRDNIPTIIRKRGKNYDAESLSDQEFLVKLESKLREEIEEYLESKSIEELIDIVEVAYRIAELRGVTKRKFEEIRTTKNKKYGAFSRNILLLSYEG